MTKAEEFISKINKKIQKAYNDNDIEKAMAYINGNAKFQYLYNQHYVDEVMEEIIKKIAKNNVFHFTENNNIDKECVLFYDSTGLDLRGLALIYVKALAEIGYKVIYVTIESARNKQPQIHSVVSNKNCIFCYINEKLGYIEYANELLKVFEKYKPKSAFLYTLPDDIAGIIAFEKMKGKCDRYLINLTDHAFWLGKYAVDYFIEFRNYGASISNLYRKIDKQRLIVLPFYPFSNEVEFEGLPFDINEKRMIFSGGALYKTMGDQEKLYYKIVSHILEHHDDVVFVYAGEGDGTELNKLERSYPKRVYHLKERRDFRELIKRSEFYLNTYPLLGGLMTQYAAQLKKIPVSLIYDDANLEILIGQKDRGIEYFSFVELVNDIDCLLNSADYLHKREQMLDGSVITEKQFTEELQNIVEHKEKNFSVQITNYNVDKFHDTYLQRFEYKKTIRNSFCNKKNKRLLLNFPLKYLEVIINRISKGKMF